MRTKLRIKNDTAWRTKDLRPFLLRILKSEFDGSTVNRRPRWDYLFHIVYNRGGKDFSYCSGRAAIHGRWARIRVPNPVHENHAHAFPVLDFCYVVGHEVGHSIGLRHSQMGLHYRRGAYSDQHYAWALELPVPQPKAPPKRPTIDARRAARLKTAQEAVTRWERKAKLAATKLKIWRRKVRRLELVQVAAARPEKIAGPPSQTACHGAASDVSSPADGHDAD